MFKKIIYLFLILSLVSCTQAPPINHEEAQANFTSYLDEELIDFLESDAVNLHFSLEDTSLYDLDLPEQTLGEINVESIEEARQINQESLDRLNQIDRRGLTDNQQKQYDIYKRYLRDTIDSSQFYLNENLFAPSSGITNNLITTFTEYRFDNEKDVNNYLMLVKDVERFLNEAIAFTQYQIDSGYFMNDFTVDETVESIDRFTSKIDDNELIVSFNNKIQDMDIEHIDELIKQNEELVKDVVIPSYNTIKEFLLNNKGKREVVGGSSVLPNGKEYYSRLVKDKTSSNIQVEKLIEMSIQYLNEKIAYIQKNNLTNGSVYDEYLKFKIEPKDALLVLKELEDKVPTKFPMGPKVSYQADYLDPSITSENVIAYYLLPPLDNITKNIIKINEASITDGVLLYTTLAHEGFPGHLYQTTYLYNQDIHPLMLQIDEIGFTEGWANYSGLEAIEWLEFENPLTAELLKFDIQFSYIMQSIVDLGVNYLGWDVSYVNELLGLGEEAAQEMVNAVISEPGQILPYGIGLMFLDTYRMEAEDKLKDKFNEIEFHEALLSNGYRTFEEVKKDVDNYVKENK